MAARAGPGRGRLSAEAEELPRPRPTRRHAVFAAVFVVTALAFLYFVLPRLAGLEDTWNRAREAAPSWLLACLAFELVSFGGYVWLFRTVCVRDHRIGWRASYQITMASLAATRLFATAGAGGIALTAWALRRSGLGARDVATRVVAQLALLYAVFLLALVVFGTGLRTGVLPGPAPFGVTVVPALFAAGLLVLVGLLALLPGDFERRLERWAGGGRRRLARRARQLAAVPAAVAAGVRAALALVRDGQWGVLGAVVWWAFDIATLWAAFEAFGEAPPPAVLVMGYFVGMLGNLLPLPGGIGGVDGGMIGAFLAFGVDGGLAVVAVLVYRGFAFWLPTIPGLVAYLQLRRTMKGWQAATIQSEVSP